VEVPVTGADPAITLDWSPRVDQPYAVIVGFQLQSRHLDRVGGKRLWP